MVEFLHDSKTPSGGSSRHRGRRLVAGDEGEEPAEGKHSADAECRADRDLLDILSVDFVEDNGLSRRWIAESLFHWHVPLLRVFDDAEYIQGAIDAGASGYLTKPIESDVLIPTIESCFRKNEELYEINKKVANINKRIETREIIEKAQLILMEKHNMSEADAYGYIKGLSKERNTSMAEIAEIVIAKSNER